MADFPTSIYSPRTKENALGVIYDALKTRVGYAEDVTKLDAEVVSIETILGLNPKWASASIAERIKGIRSLSDANEAVITIKGANVGIGTTAPGNLLHLAKSTTDGIRLESTAQNVNSFIKTTGYDTANTLRFGSAINFANVAALGANNGYITFSTWTSNTENERVRITNGGNVGIGTTAPGAKLDVESTTGSSNVFIETSVTTSNAYIDYINPGGVFRIGKERDTGGGLLAGSSGYSGVITTQSANSLHFGTNSLVRATIDSTGNVGIGTTSPTAKVDILSDILRLRTTKTPASAGAAGNAGDICWDTSYIYVCVTTNTWRRSTLASW